MFACVSVCEDSQSSVLGGFWDHHAEAGHMTLSDESGVTVGAWPPRSDPQAELGPAEPSLCSSLWLLVRY